MFKALIFASLLALGLAAALYKDNRDTTECLYTDQMWASEDLTKFYICNPATNTLLEFSCPGETLFVRNSTAEGCAPPQLMSPDCVHLAPVESCVGVYTTQPQPSQDPTKFYICPEENATPVLLPCAEGKAFLNQDGYLGCFDWTVWRELKNCPQ